MVTQDLKEVVLAFTK